MEFGENPEQAYPYCDADGGSFGTNQATGSKDPGRRCPRKKLSQDTIPAETMLWEGAQHDIHTNSILFHSPEFLCRSEIIKQLKKY